MDAGMVVGPVNSQGWFWTQVSVSMMGWPAGMAGAWPTGPPHEPMPMGGKDERAVGTPAAMNTITRVEKGPFLLHTKSPSISW